MVANADKRATLELIGAKKEAGGGWGKIPRPSSVQFVIRLQGTSKVFKKFAGAPRATLSSA